MIKTKCAWNVRFGGYLGLTKNVHLFRQAYFNSPVHQTIENLSLSYGIFSSKAPITFRPSSLTLQFIWESKLAHRADNVRLKDSKTAVSTDSNIIFINSIDDFLTSSSLSDKTIDFFGDSYSVSVIFEKRTF